MANLEDYIKVALYEKFPRNITLTSEYREREVIESFFANKFKEILISFGISEAS